LDQTQTFFVTNQWLMDLLVGIAERSVSSVYREVIWWIPWLLDYRWTQDQTHVGFQEHL